MLTTIGPTHTCPDCKAKLNCATSVNMDAKPKVGDITICVYCGCLARFDAEFQLSKLQHADLDGLDGIDEGTKSAVIETHSKVLDLIADKAFPEGTVWN